MKKRKDVARLKTFINKSNKNLITFAQYVFGACLKSGADCLSMRNITLSL